MNIVSTPLIKLFDGSVQFCIPIYQRKYAWTETNCITLLNDIIDIAKDPHREHHYAGSIIYKAESGANVGTVNKYDLIDGQQRLITVMLILWALGHYVKERTDSEAHKDPLYELANLKSIYFKNHEIYSKGDLCYKLKPIEEDEKAYKALLENEQMPTDMLKSKIYVNYQAILGHLRKEKPSPEEVTIGINKLLIANVMLAPNDNAQLLFETVNSTGERLQEVDKVRNYILMNAGSALQNALYTNNWNPMEERLGVFKNSKTLNDFFKYYATIISEDKIKDDYYSIFKDSFLGISPQAISNTVKDMDEYSKLFKRWIDANPLSKGTDLLLYRLKMTKNDKYLPVALKVLRNVQLKIMTSEDADEILRLLESYIIRRELLSMKSSAIGEAFIKILRAADSLANVKHCIVSELTTKQRMPKDSELKKMLKTQDFYHLNHARYILDRIEKYLNPAYNPDPRVSIEHIMPQTIQSSEELYAREDYNDQQKADRDWAKDLGENWKEIHENYCNTLGNLTLTGFNTQLSNCRFIIKRDLEDPSEDGLPYGYAKSVIRLSRGLNLPHWGETEILNRCDAIFTYIQAIWPYPIGVTDDEMVKNLESSYEDIDAREKVRASVLSSSDIIEIKDNALYKKTDDSIGYILQASKMYRKGSGEQYWFGYRENRLKPILSCKEKYCILICRNTGLDVLQIPIEKLDAWKSDLNNTKDANGTITHYHIYVKKDINGRFFIPLKGKSNKIDVTSYIIKI